MIRLIHEFHGEAVFHRAFDCVEDPYEAIEELIRLGTDRILTSGLKEKAAARSRSFKGASGKLWKPDPASGRKRHQRR